MELPFGDLLQFDFPLSAYLCLPYLVENWFFMGEVEKKGNLWTQHDTFYVGNQEKINLEMCAQKWKMRKTCNLISNKSTIFEKNFLTTFIF